MKYPKLHNFNEMFTPPEAMDYIVPFLDKKLIYWEACYGEGHMAEELEERGFNVVGVKEMDCLRCQPADWDFLITNPPFNGNKKFIKRAIELGKPFALLIRLEHLGGVEAMRLLKDLDFQIIIPEKRINYITPKMLRGEKVGGSQFHSIWLTRGLELEKQVNYQYNITPPNKRVRKIMLIRIRAKYKSDDKGYYFVELKEFFKAFLRIFRIFKK